MHIFLFTFWMLFFLGTFVWRVYVNHRRYGENPLVLQKDDSTYGFVSSAFKAVILLVFLINLVLLVFPGSASAASLFPSNLPLSILGVVLMLSSLMLVLIAQVHLGKSWRIGIDTQVSTELVTEGIYHRSRNPIFLGMRVALLGFFLCLPTYPVLIAVIFGELLMQIQVRLEEEHLGRLHGPTYQQYRQLTPRWW
ncbi:methyltransferase family protein [Deinococcus roseus]|uniref:Isoprenylcysteine carboxylmethyltransferase family protein n=1 Tax=Deinococcus roseus TaxID=392414 RepID=A0ABQ2D8B1_9DEIO|nr:isoprenylcysteine carboxylmethyltransferase family protein [Deinococcus roseus]GGJ47313.1 hypothetical protein GCM10008938_36700 [Deinococcus roseus]